MMNQLESPELDENGNNIPLAHETSRFLRRGLKNYAINTFETWQNMQISLLCILMLINNEICKICIKTVFLHALKGIHC